MLPTPILLPHMHLSEALVDTLQEDTRLLRQRLELATMEIQGPDESIFIRPGCLSQGVPQTY